MKKERKKNEEGKETMTYVNNKTGVCASVDYGVLTKEQTAYMDSRLEWAVGEGKVSNILKYQSDINPSV